MGLSLDVGILGKGKKTEGRWPGSIQMGYKLMGVKGEPPHSPNPFPQANDDTQRREGSKISFFPFNPRI